MNQKAFDPNKPFTTRHGRKARILGFFCNGQQMAVVVEKNPNDPTSMDTLLPLNANGRVYSNVTMISDWDLINTPAIHTYYINVYKSMFGPESGRNTLAIHESREKADSSANADRIARVKLVFEEGQFDE